MQYCDLGYVALFLPIVIILYFLTSKKHRYKILLGASFIFFYLLSKKLIIYLIFSGLSIHHFGLWLEHLKSLKKEELASGADKKQVKEKYKRQENKVIILALFIHLGLLIVLKYSSFIGNNINNLLNLIHLNYQFKVPHYIMPIGISFYTLQALSYIIDVKNGTIAADDNLGRLMLYLAFFPSIMEGPISRYKDTAEKLYSGQPLNYQNLTFGYQRILFGMLKKMIVADRLNIIVKNIFSNYPSLGGAVILAGACFYTIQLYMDFAGTMDIVIGSAEIFGVKLPENFKQPFFSKNISEFWSRWHITLGAFLRDYVFYPLSLSKSLKKLTNFGRKHFGNHFGPLLSGAIALLVVWLLNGLWHGAAWNYIFFGLYHFTLIVLADLFSPLVLKTLKLLHINRNNFFYRLLEMFKTTVLVIFGELFFRAHGLQAGFSMFKKIFTTFNLNDFSENILKLGLDKFDFRIIIVTLLIVLIISILKEKGINIREAISKKPIYIRWTLYYALILFIVIFGAYGDGYIPVDPLYANF